MFRTVSVPESSTIDKFAYDRQARKLRVVFRKSAMYEYDDVPEELVAGMVVAESVGGYFAANIRNAGFEYRKVAGGCLDSPLEATDMAFPRGIR